MIATFGDFYVSEMRWREPEARKAGTMRHESARRHHIQRHRNSVEEGDLLGFGPIGARHRRD